VQSLLFLQDACRLARTFPPSHRAPLYEKMIGLQLFSALAPFLAMSVSHSGNAEAPSPRHLALEVLLLSVLSDASHLRHFTVGKGNDPAPNTDASQVEGGRALLDGLVRLMLEDEDQGVQSQVSELLRHVLDPSQVPMQEREAFLDRLYSCGVLDSMINALDAFNSSVDGDTRRIPKLHECYALQLVCELFAFAIEVHGARASNFAMVNEIAKKASWLSAAEPHRFLQLLPIRLAKAMVSNKSNDLHDHLVESGLLPALLTRLQQSLKPPGLGGNLVTAATSDFLDHVCAQKAKVVVAHLATQHEGQLQELGVQVKAAARILHLHDQILKDAAPQSRGMPPRRSHAERLPVAGEVSSSESEDEAEGFFGSLAEASSSDAEGEGEDGAEIDAAELEEGEIEDSEEEESGDEDPEEALQEEAASANISNATEESAAQSTDGPNSSSAGSLSHAPKRARVETS